MNHTSAPFVGNFNNRRWHIIFFNLIPFLYEQPLFLKKQYIVFFENDSVSWNTIEYVLKQNMTEQSVIPNVDCNIVSFQWEAELLWNNAQKRVAYCLLVVIFFIYFPFFLTCIYHMQCAFLFVIICLISLALEL